MKPWILWAFWMGMALVAIGYGSKPALRWLLAPPYDEAFEALLLDADEKAAEQPVELTRLVPEAWDEVCNYQNGGPSNLLDDFPPENGKELRIIEGGRYITDDWSALVFIDHSRMEARVKYIAHFLLQPNACFRGRGIVLRKTDGQGHRQMTLARRP